MLKKVIPYVDYNGVERTFTAYFNLNKAEVMKMQMGVTGGLDEYLKRIIEAKDAPALITIFEDLIQKSYGVKTPDGVGFTKKKEDLDAFMSTEAYSNLFMELATDDEAAAAFIKGVIPADLADKIDATQLALPN